MSKLAKLRALLSEFRGYYSQLLITQDRFIKLAEEVVYDLRGSVDPSEFAALLKVMEPTRGIEDDQTFVGGVIKAASAEYGISTEELLSRLRGPRYDDPRTLAIRIAKDRTGLTNPELAVLFRRSKAAIQMALKSASIRMERSRDLSGRCERIKARLVKQQAA